MAREYIFYLLITSKNKDKLIAAKTSHETVEIGCLEASTALYLRRNCFLLRFLASRATGLICSHLPSKHRKLIFYQNNLLPMTRPGYLVSKNMWYFYGKQCLNIVMHWVMTILLIYYFHMIIVRITVTTKWSIQFSMHKIHWNSFNLRGK